MFNLGLVSSFSAVLVRNYEQIILHSFLLQPAELRDYFCWEKGRREGRGQKRVGMKHRKRWGVGDVVVLVQVLVSKTVASVVHLCTPAREHDTTDLFDLVAELVDLDLQVSYLTY